MPRRQRYTRNLGRRDVGPLPPRRPDARYIRFEHPTERLGVFTFVDKAQETLDEEGRAELEALMSWFDEHLEEPSRMVPFRDAGPRAHRYRWAETTAICWFRAEAIEHLLHARRVVELVQRAGIPMIERCVDRIPGKVCSEDEVQIAVQVFRDVRTP